MQYIYLKLIAFSRLTILCFSSLIFRRQLSLIFGDSHARQFFYIGAKSSTSALFLGMDGSISRGQILFWIGPRTAYGFSKNGFKYYRERVIFNFLCYICIKIYYSFGEIDLRVHSDKAWGSPESVYSSLTSIAANLHLYCRSLNLERLIVPLLPPPPNQASESLSGTYQPSSAYEQRLSAWKLLFSYCLYSKSFDYLSPRKSLICEALSRLDTLFTDPIHLNQSGVQTFYPIEE